MLDKGIKYGKEHRKPYRGVKAVDRKCRNHGDCSYCKANRLWQRTKAIEKMKSDENDFDIKERI